MTSVMTPASSSIQVKSSALMGGWPNPKRTDLNGFEASLIKDILVDIDIAPAKVLPNFIVSKHVADARLISLSTSLWSMSSSVTSFSFSFMWMFCQSERYWIVSAVSRTLQSPFLYVCLLFFDAEYLWMKDIRCGHHRWLRVCGGE